MGEEMLREDVGAAEAAIVVEQPGDGVSAGAYARRLDEAPIRAKVAVLVLAGSVFGAIVGIVETRLGHMGWPLTLGLTVVAGGLILLGQYWVATPIDRLTQRLDRIARNKTTHLLKELPIRRADEVGRIASSVHDLASSAFRCDHEARQLRRTMHSSIEKATLRATRRLREIAMRDPLTNLGNRRFLDDQLPALVDATRETGTELVCVMMDLDNFKAVNDTLGHAVGDELLKLIGELLIGSVREADMAVRLGGDEFVVFMPGTDVGRAQRLAEHVRQLFRQQTRTRHPDGPHADISVGIASMRGDGLADGAQLLERADQHLYHAKRGGKGRTYAGAKCA